MISLSGYNNFEVLHQSTANMLVGAIDTATGREVTLKYPHPQTATLDQIGRIHSEYEILKKLNSTYVVDLLDLREFEGVPVLIMARTSHPSLAVRLRTKQFTPTEVFTLASHITRALDDIHSSGVIYKNLTPENILVDDALEHPVLIDFSLAVFDNVTHRADESQYLEGNAEYISPEQTGRLNRTVDYRSDIYSLGATLYQLATGTPPFKGQDFLELIFQHLAKHPATPSSLNQALPKTLDNIILKLLEKEPEERYQSTFAVLSDLKNAQALYEQDPTAGDHFTVALDDIPEQLSVPTKLLQRDQELEQLRSVLQATGSDDATTIALIGDAGTGKTSMLRELAKSTVEIGGLHCICKGTLTNKDIPLSTIGALLAELCKLLLSRDDLPQLQNYLNQRLGQKLEYLVEINPDLQRVIGRNVGTPQHAEPLETFARIQEAFIEFVTAVANHTRPLVICLDNSDWIDSTSFELIAATCGRNIPGLVTLITSRTTLSSDAQPVKQFLRQLVPIYLTNLHIDSIKSLISSCTFRSPQEIEDLAAIVYDKTRGNPLAVREFLNDINRKKLLHFDRTHREWVWDLNGITRAPPTNNVGEVLAKHLNKLDAKTLDMIKIASCVGDEFDLDTIKRVSGMTFSDCSACLTRAVTEGFVMHSDGGKRSTYQFAHEHIQQAAYQLLSGIERGQIHAQIGRTYLSLGDPDSRIFEVVNQLNNSFNEVSSTAKERLELASLNLNAGRKAKTAAAFQASFRYLRMAIAVQGKEVWDNHELSLEAHLEAAEAAYFCGDKGRLNPLIQTILDHAKTPLEKTLAYEIQLKSLIASNDLDLALEIGNEVLTLLNQKVPRSLSKHQLAFWTLKIVIKARTTKANKLMSDPEDLAAMRIMRILSQAGYLAGRFSTAAYTLKMTELSLRKGQAPESSFAFPLFGAIIIRQFGMISLGYEFGELALKNLQDANPRLISVTHAIVHSFISFWKQNLRSSLEPLTRAEEIGFEQGDIEFAQIAGTAACLNGFVAGQDLNTLDSSFGERNKNAREFNQRPMLDLGTIFQQAIQNLIQDPEQPWVLEGELYNEAIKEPEHRSKSDYTSLTNLYIVKTMLAVVFRAQDEAFGYALVARKYLSSLISSPLIPFFTVFESLVYINQLQRESPLQIVKLKTQISHNVRSLRKWARHSAVNNTAGYNLVLAELARVNQTPDDAVKYYEIAMTAAEQNGQNHVLALAQELTGRFYGRIDSASLSTFYLLRARNSYLRWGSANKVKALDQEYKDLAEQGSRYFRRSQTTRENTEHAYGDYLDLGSVIKASQALSGEIILSTLLEKLMQVALENAGAHSAGLVLADNDGLWVEILSRYNGVTTDHRLQRQRITECLDLPSSIIQYVARTEEDLVLNDASSEDLFTQDSYISRVKPRSVLCVPILSKSHLTGILYLENLHSKSAFSEDRVAVLRLLASQSAIAIENAKLYQQLNESRDKYLSLYENAVEGIFEVDMTGELISLNPAAMQLVGYPEAAEGSRHKVELSDFFVDPNELELFIRRLLAEYRVVGYESRLKRLDNQEIWVAISAHVIFDNNKPVKVDGSVIDITERKLRQQAEQATRLAEAATATKSQFLANMSHEIRTPMNAILGYTSLALETQLDQKQLEYLQTIQRSSNHLLQVVNDILDISKIESGKLELTNTTFDLAAVLADIGKLFKLEAEKKQLSFVMPTVAVGSYHGDAVRLGQVLINLISNAIKFTDHGSVVVSLDVLPLHDGRHSLNFVVADSGRGIAPEETNKIFEAFSQASNVTSRESGTGLGLAISRNIVEQMKGQITVTSTPGIGSKFSFSVVLEPDAEASIAALPSQREKNTSTSGSVLLVEDNPINRNLAREVLRKNGYKVVEAENGKEALDLLEQEEFGVVLMDLRMPIMSGNEAIIEIRKRERTRNIPVIALSAGVLQHEIDEALANGFDHYATKPVDFEKLLALLATVSHTEPALDASLASGITATTEDFSIETTVQPETETPQAEIEIGHQSGADDADILIVDFELALANHDGDQDLLNRLLSDFVEFYAGSPQQLSAAISENRFEAAERLMHNLAGLAGTFGAESLMRLCRRHEKTISREQTLSPQHQDEFRRTMAAFVNAIQQYLSEGTTAAGSL